MSRGGRPPTVPAMPVTRHRPRAAAAARPGPAPADRPVPVRVLINANASAATGPQRRDRLVRALREAGADVTLELTRSVAELEAAWHEEDGRRLVLVGGDGSIHAAVNAGGPGRAVALIPAGKANNIARCTGIPLRLDLAAALAVRGHVRPMDLIEARTALRRRMVVESVSVGFLAQARVRYHGRNSADLVAGLRAGGGALRAFRPFGARVRTASGTETLTLAQLFVANLPLYEFGLHVAPGADPVDGVLDCVGLEAPTRLAVLRMVLALRRGSTPLRDVHVWRTPAVRISTGGCSPVVADSENLGAGPVTLTAAPGALALVRP